MTPEYADLMVVLGREFGYRPHEVAALPIRTMRVLVAGLQRAREADAGDDVPGVATQERREPLPMSDVDLRRLGAGLPI